MGSVTFVNYQLTMKAGFYLQCVFLCFLVAGLNSPSVGQYISDRDTNYLLEGVTVSTAIPPFYQNLDEKTYYHSRQIHGMKEDINAHSRNLRDLRMRFNKVFYGRKTSGGAADPFQVGATPQMPIQKDESPKMEYIPPSAKEPRVHYEPSQADANIEADSQMVSIEGVAPENQLAFSVQEPGSYQSHDGRQINPEPKAVSTGFFSRARRFDYYIMPRVSLALPSQIEKNINHPKPHYKRYQIGSSATLSGGIRLDRWRLGIAGVHQRHELHQTSWAKESPNGPRFDRTGKTRSFAFMIEASHLIPLYSALFINLDLGVGYRWAKSSYEYSNAVSPTETSSIAEDYWLWSVGAGIGWSFSEQVSLLLAYRYFGEETLPTHNADLGLVFDF